MERKDRVLAVNKLVEVIGSCGRQFFYHKGRFAEIHVDRRGRAWWTDEYTQSVIYTHNAGFKSEWRGFSHGGTLRGLVEHFRDYVTKGIPVPVHVFGPWPEWMCGGDLWGYGDDMQKVQTTAVELGITVA